MAFGCFIITFPMKMRIWGVQPMSKPCLCDIPWTRDASDAPVHSEGMSLETTSGPWLAASQPPLNDASAVGVWKWRTPSKEP